MSAIEAEQRGSLLEIGTGWGALAIHAAKHYGCRVTQPPFLKSNISGRKNVLNKKGWVIVLPCCLTIGSTGSTIKWFRLKWSKRLVKVPHDLYQKVPIFA